MKRLIVNVLPAFTQTNTNVKCSYCKEEIEIGSEYHNILILNEVSDINYDMILKYHVECMNKVVEIIGAS